MWMEGGNGHLLSPNLLVLTVAFLCLPTTVRPFPTDVFEPRYELIQEGDINIGAIMSLHTWKAGRCSRQTLGMNSVEFLEALLYAVRRVNEEKILDGVSLGVYALDDCFSSSLTLMRAVQFMPGMAGHGPQASGEYQTPIVPDLPLSEGAAHVRRSSDSAYDPHEELAGGKPLNMAYTLYQKPPENLQSVENRSSEETNMTDTSSSTVSNDQAVFTETVNGSDQQVSQDEKLEEQFRPSFSGITGGQSKVPDRTDKFSSTICACRLDNSSAGAGDDSNLSGINQTEPASMRVLYRCVQNNASECRLVGFLECINYTATQISSGITSCSCGADRVNLAINRVQLHSDGVESPADRIQSPADSVRSSADKTQSSTDGTQSPRDSLQSSTDTAQFSTDGVQSPIDDVQSLFDRVSSSRDRVSSPADSNLKNIPSKRTPPCTAIPDCLTQTPLLLDGSSEKLSVPGNKPSADLSDKPEANESPSSLPKAENLLAVCCCCVEMCDQPESSDTRQERTHDLASHSTSADVSAHSRHRRKKRSGSKGPNLTHLNRQRPPLDRAEGVVGLSGSKSGSEETSKFQLNRTIFKRSSTNNTVLEKSSAHTRKAVHIQNDTNRTVLEKSKTDTNEALDTKSFMRTLSRPYRTAVKRSNNNTNRASYTKSFMRKFSRSKTRRSVPSSNEHNAFRRHVGILTNAEITNRMPKFFDVVGVIGAYTSQHSIDVARMLQLFSLPQVSPSSTSDELSDKSRFPFFLRTLPSDRDQVQALARVVRHFNWTYVSLVYSADSYGQNGQSKLSKMLTSLDVCVALSRTLSSNMSPSAYDAVIADLRKYKQARAVLLYADVKHVRPLMAAVERNNAYREFIWVGSDAVFNEFQYNPKVCDQNLGSIAVIPHAVTPPAFISHMVSKIRQRLNASSVGNVGSIPSKADGVSRLPSRAGGVGESPTPPALEDSLEWWIPDVKEAAEYIHAAERVNSTRPMFAVAAFVIDAVYAFAYAIRDLLHDNCPDAQGLEARQCVKRHFLHSYLKRVSFEGTSGRFEFDENGDVVGEIEIRQCQKKEGRSSCQLIGEWEHRHANITIGASFPDHDEGVPVSVCASPCELGQIYSFTRQTCCWTCVTCKPNEVTTANASGCLPCPRFQWPDPLTRRRCEHIDVPLTPTDPVVTLVLQVAAVVGLMVTSVTAFTFVLYRGQRVIRSSSRELSGLMLGGLGSAFLLVFPLLSTPSPLTCYTTHVGFGMTFTLVYAPLVVKTHRIFRIFRAGRQSAALPRCTSCASQMAIAMVLIAVQVVTVTVSTALEPPRAELRQAVLTERVVERLCRLPLGGVVAALVYNMLLVLVCTVLAFKTRRLPDNYNESRYIAFCVDTTLLVWLTFIPAYFTATLAAHKVLVLALALLLNSSVHLSCLFMPRLYALYRVTRSAATPSGDKTFGSYGQIPLRASSAVSMLTRSAVCEDGVRETTRNMSGSDVIESSCLHVSCSEVMEPKRRHRSCGVDATGRLRSADRESCSQGLMSDEDGDLRRSDSGVIEIKIHTSENDVFDSEEEEEPASDGSENARNSVVRRSEMTELDSGALCGSNSIEKDSNRPPKLNNGASMSSPAHNCSGRESTFVRNFTKGSARKSGSSSRSPADNCDSGVS